jgi:hypothetical protein
MSKSQRAPVVDSVLDVDAWCRRAMRSRIEPMKKIARSLRVHRSLILNWFRARQLIACGVALVANVNAYGAMPRADECAPVGAAVLRDFNPCGLSSEAAASHQPRATP